MKISNPFEQFTIYKNTETLITETIIQVEGDAEINLTINNTFSILEGIKFFLLFVLCFPVILFLIQFCFMKKFRAFQDLKRPMPKKFKPFNEMFIILKNHTIKVIGIYFMTSILFCTSLFMVTIDLNNN